MTSTLPLATIDETTEVTQQPDLFLRSLHADWDEARWSTLSHDTGLRYEVIDGVLYMGTSPSPKHQWITNCLARKFFAQIQDKSAGIILWTPVGLFMPGTDPVQPDIMILKPEDKGLIAAGKLATIPLLIVEILSPSNADHDLVTKRNAYAHADVPEYWILRPTEQDVLVHSDPEPTTGLYRQVRRIAPDADLVAATLPFRTPVRDLFAEL
jgi:Uma2 family endonuclease